MSIKIEDLVDATVQAVALADIKITGDRQRKTFDEEAITELMEDIEKNSLLHAPACRTPRAEEIAKDPSLAGKLILVSGERRLRALKEMHFLGKDFIHNETLYAAAQGWIPYVSLGELTWEEAEEAELSENVRRVDLTWQERAEATARLMRLRTAIAEKTAVAEAKPIQAPTIAKIAQELGRSASGSGYQATRAEVLLGQALADPAKRALVSKAPNVNEALNMLRKAEQREKNIQLATEVGRTSLFDQHKIFQESCIDWMARGAADLSGVRFDVICSDPPYGMNAHRFGYVPGKVTDISHDYGDSPENWLELMQKFIPLTAVMAKPAAHMYLFCDLDKFHVLRQMAEDHGWKVFRTPLVYQKLNSGRVPWPEHGPRRQYELVLYAMRGDKPVEHIHSDVFSAQQDAGMVTHGATKPVAAWQSLLQRSCRPGDIILDPFAGTGGLLEAAHAMKCVAYCIEQSPEAYGSIIHRIDRMKAAETMPLGI